MWWCREGDGVPAPRPHTEERLVERMYSLTPLPPPTHFAKRSDSLHCIALCGGFAAEPDPARGRSVLTPFQSLRDGGTSLIRQLLGYGSGAARAPPPPPPPAPSWSQPSLSVLFAPPKDVLFVGTFDAAAVDAVQRKRYHRPCTSTTHHPLFISSHPLFCVTRSWLLINIQSNDEFASHMLNRDVWYRPHTPLLLPCPAPPCASPLERWVGCRKEESVKSLVRQSFTLWQSDCGTEPARKVCRIYSIAAFPFIGLLLSTVCT
jgi:hypothetical protein